MKLVFIFRVVIYIIPLFSATSETKLVSFGSGVDHIKLDCNSANSANSIIRIEDVTIANKQCCFKNDKCHNESIKDVRGTCDKRNNCSMDFPICLLEQRYFNLSYTVEQDIACDFEVSLCNWKTSNFKRSRAKDVIEVANDTTTGSGYGYLLYTSINGSILKSPTIKSGTVKCLTFWYYLSSHASLYIGLKEKDNYTSIKTETAANSWRIFEENLYDYDLERHNEYTVELMAVTYTNGNFLCVIDDIDLLDGKCQVDGKLRINFENDTQINSSMKIESSWRRRGPSENTSPCPSIDHTTNSVHGHFLAIEKNEQTSSSTNMENFKFFKAGTGNACLKFWYVMTGTRNTFIKVHQGDGHAKQTIFKNFSRNNWRMRSYNLTGERRNNTIIYFEAKIYGNNGCIAIDDISVTTGYCKDQYINDFYRYNNTTRLDTIQLRCPMANIPDRYVHVITEPDDIVKDDAYTNTCTPFVKKLEEKISNTCTTTLRPCDISSILPNSDNCFWLLRKLQPEIRIDYECKEITTGSSRSTITTTPQITKSIQNYTKQHTSTSTFSLYTSTPQLYTYPTRVTSQHYGTTENDQNNGIIVGVVFSLLFICAIAIGIFCFLRRSNYFKKEKEKKDSMMLNIPTGTIGVSRESHKYVTISKTNQNDHIYKVISNSLETRDSAIDGAEYMSIDDTQNVVQQNTNVSIPQEYITIADEQSDSVNGKSVQHLVDPSSNYDELDPSIFGFNQSQSPNEGGSILYHHGYNNRDDCKELKGPKPDASANLDPNESLSKTNTVMKGNQPIDNYMLLDLNDTGCDRSNIMESKSESLIDEYSVLDSNVTGFNRSTQNESRNKLADDNYSVLDPKETGFDRLKQVNETKSEDYTVLDPNETGFDRSSEKRNHKYQDGTYKLTEPLSSQTDDDHYTCSKEGNYDELGLDRHKVEKDNVYSHTVETVYDTTSHVQKQERIEDTYDHFVGQRN